MDRGLPCSREKLESMKLHEVSLKVYCNDFLLLRNTSYEDGPTCDDMHILFNNRVRLKN
jgi:hypothetical protein